MDKPNQDQHEPSPRILVVDPDSSSRRLLKAALGMDKYEVLESSSGHDALNRFASASAAEKPNLTIVDPSHHLTGWPIIGSFREAMPDRAILVHSVAFSNKSIAQAMELGADDYLFKPVDIGELRRTVGILLKPRKCHLPNFKPSTDLEPAKLGLSSDGDGTYLEMTALTGSPHVERFVCFAKRLLEKWLEPQECFSMRQALEEMVTNAMEWGNRGDANKSVKLSYCILKDRVSLRVEDQGEGFNRQAVPDPSVDPMAHLKRRKSEGKRVGGWGLFLTSKAVDEVTYNDKGNVVRLTKFLKPRTTENHFKKPASSVKLPVVE